MFVRSKPEEPAPEPVEAAYRVPFDTRLRRYSRCEEIMPSSSRAGPWGPSIRPGLDPGRTQGEGFASSRTDPPRHRFGQATRRIESLP